MVARGSARDGKRFRKHGAHNAKSTQVYTGHMDRTQLEKVTHFDVPHQNGAAEPLWSSAAVGGSDCYVALTVNVNG
jgi:hypothetical protein